MSSPETSAQLGDAAVAGIIAGSVVVVGIIVLVVVWFIKTQRRHGLGPTESLNSKDTEDTAVDSPGFMTSNQTEEERVRRKGRKEKSDITPAQVTKANRDKETTDDRDQDLKGVGKRGPLRGVTFSSRLRKGGDVKEIGCDNEPHLSPHRKRTPTKPAMKQLKRASIFLSDDDDDDDDDEDDADGGNDAVRVAGTDSDVASGYAPSGSGDKDAGSYAFSDYSSFSTTSSFRDHYAQQFQQYQKLQKMQFQYQQQQQQQQQFTGGQKLVNAYTEYSVGPISSRSPLQQMHTYPQPQNLTPEEQAQQQKLAYHVYKQQKAAAQARPVSQGFVNAWWQAFFQYNPQAAYAQYYAMTGRDPFAAASAAEGESHEGEGDGTTNAQIAG
ncbi:hypothetical protein BDR26DRAFT_871972 [Obelidium mucronatum]|nr:hypothetical protein BDR26DRAFT_871972 [Obelidium mucronatum]